MFVDVVAVLVRLFDRRPDDWDYEESDALAGWVAPSTDWQASY